MQLEAERGEEQEMEYDNGSCVNLKKMSTPSRLALQRDEMDDNEIFYLREQSNCYERFSRNR